MSPWPSSCPDPTVLHAFVLGTLPEAEAGPVEDHLAICPQCVETLRQLSLARPSAVPPDSVEAPPPLVARILSALRGDGSAPSKPQPADDPAAAPPPHAPGQEPFGSTYVPGPSSSGSRVIAGRYKLIEPIGEGGMGTVYLAEQGEPVRRKVAVKLIKLGCDSKAVLTRFKAEQQAIALMDHPHIARLFDAGITERGEPFFVMELIQGLPIAEYCDDQRLGIDDRIRLVIQVCHAVEHAHQKGIIHRDLKSPNILVALFDGRPVVKVIDFGLAKALGQSLTHETSPSLFGMVVGTPGYMAPEQATSNQLDVDARSDIYALSAVLYELLTGSTPHDQAELRKKGLMEILRSIREDEPPAASKRLSSSGALPGLAASRRSAPRRLIQSIRGELDLVVMKGLQRERARRYQHPSDFAADLQRLLSGEPVHAVPPSLGYLAAKLLRKRWKGLVVAGLLLLVALAGAAGVVVQKLENQRIAAQAESSQLKADAAEKQRQLAVARQKQLASEAELEKARADAIQREAAAGEYFGLLGEIADEEQSRRAGWRTRALDKVQAAAQIDTAKRSLSELRTLVSRIAQSPDIDPKPEWTLQGQSVPTHKQPMAFSPSGKLLAIALSPHLLSPHPTVLVLDATTGKVVHRLVEKVTSLPFGIGGRTGRSLGAPRVAPNCVTFGVSDSVLYVGLRDGRLFRWTLNETPAAISVKAAKAETWISLTPDGRFVLTHVTFPQDDDDLRIRCWDANDLTLRSQTDVLQGVGAIGFVPDSRTALVAAPRATLMFSVPDLAGKGELAPLPEASLNAATGLGVTAGNGRLKLISISNLDPIAHFDWPRRSGFTQGFCKPRFSAGGTRVACLNRSVNQVGVWQLGDLSPFATLALVGEMAIDDVDISPQGERLVVATRSDESQPNDANLVAGFHIRPSPAFHRVFVGAAGRRVSAAPDGGEVAAYFGDDRAHRFVAKTEHLELHSVAITNVQADPGLGRGDLTYSPDSRWLVATGDRTGSQVSLKIISRAPDASIRTVAIPSHQTGLYKFKSGRIRGLGWTAAGHLVGAVHHRIMGWNLDPKIPQELSGIDTPAPRPAPTPYAAFWMQGDSGWALTEDRQLQRVVFSGARLSIAERRALPGKGLPIFAAGHDEAGLLAVGDDRGTVQIVDLRSGILVAEDQATHSDQVESVAWCGPARFVTASRDGWIVIWQVSGRTFAPEYRIPFRSGISSMATSPDGKRAYVTCQGDSNLTTVDLAALDQLFETLGIR